MRYTVRVYPLPEGGVMVHTPIDFLRLGQAEVYQLYSLLDDLITARDPAQRAAELLGEARSIIESLATDVGLARAHDLTSDDAMTSVGSSHD